MVLAFKTSTISTQYDWTINYLLGTAETTSQPENSAHCIMNSSYRLLGKTFVGLQEKQCSDKTVVTNCLKYQVDIIFLVFFCFSGK